MQKPQKMCKIVHKRLKITKIKVEGQAENDTVWGLQILTSPGGVFFCLGHIFCLIGLLQFLPNPKLVVCGWQSDRLQVDSVEGVKFVSVHFQ